MGQVIQKHSFETRKRHAELENLVAEKEKEIKKGYLSPIRLYVDYCIRTDQPENMQSMLDYLYTSITTEKIKKTTWELRLVSIRRYLSVRYGVSVTDNPQTVNTLKVLRAKFKEKEHASQIKLEGKLPVPKDELLEMIDKLPVRARAITLVNLVTACRPSEMVALKVEHFNLENRSVGVYLEKQSEWKDKRLTQDAVKAVRDYIKAYKLKPGDFFVGRFNYRKSGKYESVEISEVAYTKFLKKHLQLTAYNFRKTQVVSMHEKGADLKTISAQTGHKSLEVIAKHYLSVSNSTVDKYL